MRGVAVVVGGALLIGGAAMVVLADQQRVDALAEARAAVEQAEDSLQDVRDANYRLAEKLTSLRSRIADQESELADSTGFLP